MTRAARPRAAPPRTPDGRYIVVRGRLWRASDPSLSAERKQQLVRALMVARRLLAGGPPTQATERRARRAIHQIKVWLGERGAVWWQDGARDWTRTLARNSPYANWAAAQRDPSAASSASHGR